jgi:uncharacterized protein YndB with AHSA1/START domain
MEGNNAAAVDAGKEFTVTRRFDAPRELVFAIWSEAEHLAHWWGPKGFAIEVLAFDFRPGGIFHYSMRPPGGAQMWGRFLYREIVPPERIVWINSFADEHGNIVRAPFGGDVPLEMLNTITLAEHDGITTLTLRSMPFNATDAERATFDAMYESMQGGWKGTFDQLEEYLAAM